MSPVKVIRKNKSMVIRRKLNNGWQWKSKLSTICRQLKLKNENPVARKIRITVDDRKN